MDVNLHSSQITNHAGKLGPKSAVPTLAALQMQRWALILMAYNYDLEYKKSADHSNADAMSRIPLGELDRMAEESKIFYLSNVEDLPVPSYSIDCQEKLTVCGPVVRLVGPPGHCSPGVQAADPTGSAS